MIDPLPFATYSFVMSITPGPNNVMLTASGATYGFKRTLPAVMGVAVGFTALLGAVSLGLGTIFMRWPILQTILSWVGAAYLLYLGWRLLGSGEASQAQARPVSFVEAALFQLLNPKAWVMTLTATALFLPREMGLWAACAYMIAVTFVVNLPCITVWALFGSSLRRFLTRPSRRHAFNGLMALGLAGTGVLMVI